MLLYTLVTMGALIFFASLFLATYQGMLAWSRRAGEATKARAAAMAGIGDGLYQLSQNTSWRQGFDHARLSNGATYTVSFDPAQAPFSTSNAKGTTALNGQGGRVVPAGFVDLISVGRFGSATRQQEARVDVSSGSPALTGRWDD